MKRIITLVMVVALAIPSFAQFEKPKSRFNHSGMEYYFGLRLGLNVATMSSDSPAYDTDSRSGFAIGGVYGLQLSRTTPLWIEAGLMYSEKGGEVHINDDKITYRMCYLQLPIVVKYNFNVDDDFFIQPFFGGYLALGVGGKTKDYKELESWSTFDDMNRFDGGLRLGCGVEYKMMYAELGYDLGLANIADNDFYSTRTRNFFVNVGVNF